MEDLLGPYRAPLAILAHNGVIFPAAGYISIVEAAMHSGRCPNFINRVIVKDVSFESAPPVRTDDMGTEVLFEMQPILASVMTQKS